MIFQRTNIRLSERGFTLAELCLVMGIIGLTASLSWPSLQQFSGHLSARASAHSLADELSEAREKAVVLGEHQLIRVTARPYLITAAGVVDFQPDGSGAPFEARFGTCQKEFIAVHVQQTGEIDVREL